MDVDAFAASVRNGVTVWDTRPTAQAARDPVPGAVPITVAQIRHGRLPDLGHDAEVILVCEWGRLSELAGLYLEARGFSRVGHLTGGIDALRRAAVRDAKPGMESR